MKGFSWDFSALYDNLSPKLVTEALKTAISELRRDWTPQFVNWIMSLVNLSLKSSFAKHGKNWFKSKIGIPTGGSLSVTLANIAVYFDLRKIIYDNSKCPKELYGLKRSVDHDVGGVWTGTCRQFEVFSDNVNRKLKEYGLSIKDSDKDLWDFNDTDDYIYCILRY